MGAFGGVRALAHQVPTVLQVMDRVVELLEPVFPGRVALDVKDVNPPGLLLQPPLLRFRFAEGTYAIEHTLLIVASNTTRRVALDDLGVMVQQAQAALDNRAVTARPVDVWNQDNTAILAGYELTWTDSVRR
jgi:hypothetical protein